MSGLRRTSGFVYLISDDPAQIVTDYRKLRQIEETQLYAVRNTDSTPSPAQPGAPTSSGRAC